MAGSAQWVDILMYHSISDGDGPTCISPDIFRQQMDALSDCGCHIVTMADIVRWHAGELELPEKSVAITFDDAFADFAESAHPILKSRAWPAIVFVPTDKVGQTADWDDPGSPDDAAQLMTWEQISDLAHETIEFGSHSVTHSDLTQMPDAAVRKELDVSKATLDDRLKSKTIAFAPPFGHSNPSVRHKIATYYQVSVGTRLARATRQDDLFDLPRIEMHYFRDPARWRNHLMGQGNFYLKARQSARAVRHLLGL